MNFGSVDERNKVFIALGLILLGLFLTQTDFLGSFITDCENTEPISFEDYKTQLLLIGGWTSMTADYTYTGINLERRDASATTIGKFQIIDPEQSCNAFLAEVDNRIEGTGYTTINQRPALVTPHGILWCNFENNVAMLATTSDVIVSYYAQFEVCTTAAGTVADVQDTPDTVIDPLDEIPEEEEGRQDTDTQTPANNNQQNNTVVMEEEESISPIMLLALGIAGGILFAVYWKFERGPNKGFVRKKRGRRK